MAVALSAWRRERLGKIKNSTSSRRKRLFLPGGHIRTSVVVKEYLDQVGKIDVPAQWLTVKQAMSSQCVGSSHSLPVVFFVDTEFGYRSKSEPRVLFQVAVFGASGSCLLEENIKYNGTVEELAESSQASTRVRFRRTIARVYKVDLNNVEHKTNQIPGITLHQLADKLIKIGINKQSIILDWSVVACDRRVLADNLVRIGRDNMLPLAPQWLLPAKEWRRLIPGMGTFALELSFPLFYPVESTKEDLLQHHLARGDCEKLFLMVKKLVEYIK